MVARGDSKLRSAGVETPLYVHVLAVVLVVLPCVAVSQFTAHLETGNLDDHFHAYCGWRIWQGDALYRDVWDNKPPGLHWIDALGFALSGGRYAGVIGVCVLAVVAGYGLFFVVARQVYTRGTAALATMLAGLYMTHSLFFGGSSRSETFLVPCELALIALYLLGFRGNRRLCWYSAGLFGGCAFLFKQTGLAALAAVGLHTIVLLLLRELAWRPACRRAALFLGGVATVAVAAAVVLATQGALTDAGYAIFGFNYEVITHNLGGPADGLWWSRWLEGRGASLLILPLLMALIAVLHAALWRLRPRSRPSDVADRLDPPLSTCPRYLTLFGAWFAFAAALALASPATMAHRFLPVIPPLLLLAAYLINILKAELSLLKRMAQRAWILVACVLICYFASDAAYAQFQKAAKVYWDRSPRIENGRWTINLTPAEWIGEQIAQITDPSDTMQCWEYVPAAYLRARRPSACRILTAGFASRLPPGANPITREFHATLQRNPPKVIVVSATAYRALCDADAAPPGATEPARRSETCRNDAPATRPVGRWLNENYRRRADLTRGNLYVLIRDDTTQKHQGVKTSMPGR